MNSKGKLFLILNIVLVVLWCGVIFYLSSKTAPKSDGQSLPIAKEIVKAIDSVEGKKSPEPIIIEKAKEFNNYLRDSAHSFCYFVLALLVVSLLHQLKNVKRKAFFLTVVFCMLYAISDEIHQLFVPGRAFQIIDLTYDLFGVLCGLGLFYFVKLMLFRIKRRVKHL